MNNNPSESSSLEELQNIIDYQRKIYNILIKLKFPETDVHPKKLLKLTSGFGVSNALYEKFSKTMMQIYCNIINNRIDYIIKYKSIAKIQDFVSELKLNLENQFNLKKSELDLQMPIQDYNDLLARFKNSYLKRNYYIHGDFAFNESIDNNTFEEYVIEVMKLQIFTTELLKNAFIAELSNYILNCEEN